MPLKDILQEVEKRKENEISKISQEYKEKLDSISSRKDNEIKELESRYKARTEDDIKALTERETLLAEMEAKSLERDRVSEVLDKALEKAGFFVSNIADSGEYHKILTKMVNLATETLGDDCVVYARKKDLSFLQDMNRIKVAKKNISEPGIIAESADGSRELDLTVSTILEGLRERLSLELMEHLGEE